MRSVYRQHHCSVSNIWVMRTLQMFASAGVVVTALLLAVPAANALPVDVSAGAAENTVDVGIVIITLTLDLEVQLPGLDAELG